MRKRINNDVQTNNSHTMKIELKKISFNERMSEETNCFVADLYINGKKVGYCKNDGHGGCTDYHGNTKEDNQVIAEAEAYFKSLPMKKCEEYNFEYQPTLEEAIDEQFELYLKQREEKKMQKLMLKAILFGRLNANSYKYINYKQPLSGIPTNVLQTVVNQIKTRHCKDGVQILNTNLQALGITL